MERGSMSASQAESIARAFEMPDDLFALMSEVLNLQTVKATDEDRNPNMCGYTVVESRKRPGNFYRRYADGRKPVICDETGAEI
jgi:hypothetical protein